jgi:hypothetical protein
MSKIKYILLIIGVMCSFGLASAPPALAASDVKSFCAGLSATERAASSVCKDSDKNIFSITSKIVSFILYACGAAAVVMIIYSGFLYVTSGGSDETIKKAKNTILYSVIGLIVVLLAYAIVRFVLQLI